MKTDTIVAIATAMAGAGLGIVRISGPDAIYVADLVFFEKGGRKLAGTESHTIRYGEIRENGEVIDEVIVLLMRAPRSYTREDTVEIDCHGGVYVIKRIMEAVVKSGARPAEPGEFTKRAFLNGRLDLSQAESVMDVIQAQNEFALKSSVRQLSGSVSRAIREIRAELLHEVAFIESALDDPEHFSVDGYSIRLEAIVNSVVKKVEKLIASSDNGRILKEGISTVIVGKPNAGKSSLLNSMLGEERAIVTEIAGTTRDVLKEQMNLNGIVLNIVDTAGIRYTEDVVEKIGVDKARQYLEDADLVIYVVDRSTKLDENDFDIMERLVDKKVIVLLNKSDLHAEIKEDELQPFLEKMQDDCRMISVSAKEQTGMDELYQAVKDLFFSGELRFNDEVYITNIRHKAALGNALESLLLVRKSIEDEMPEDFFSIDLMNAYEELGSIIGEAVEEDLVEEIFRSFCVGK